MALESATTTSELVDTNPTNSDQVSQGAAHIRMLKSVVQDSLREKLTATYNLYVRTDGSDSNTGLANTSGAAFLTIQAAVNKLYTLDCNNKTVNINVADGTYTDTVLVNGKSLVGCTSLSIIGNTTTPANVVLNVTGGCIKAVGDVYLFVSGVKTQATTHGLEAQFGATLEAGKINHGACTTSHMYANFGGIIYTSDSHTVSGAAGCHLLAYRGGKITTSAYGATTTTISGTPAWGVAGAKAEGAGSQISNGGTTFSGSSTGVRASAVLNGVTDAAGGGASFWPGGSANTSATGGQNGT